MILEIYLQKYYSPETAKAYEREIGIYLQNFPKARTAGYKAITDYIGALRKRYRKASTINRILSSIKVYYDYLCFIDFREDNPAKSIQLRDTRNKDIQLQDLLSNDELELLLNRKERYSALETRNKVLISLFIYQALTPTEAAKISLSNVNLESGKILVKPTGKTKERELPLRPNQIILFYRYLTETRPELIKDNQAEQSFLTGIRGNKMSAGDITKHVNRSFKDEYKNRKITVQIIRQSVIANLLKQGNDIGIVQAFAGHKNPTSTIRYRQSEIETLQAAVNKHHPMK